MGLERFRILPELDEDGNEVPTYTNLSIIQSNLRQLRNPKHSYEDYDITNRRIAIIEDE